MFNYRLPQSAELEYVTVATVDELGPGQRKLVDVDGEPVEVGLIGDRARHRAGIGPKLGYSGVERFLPAAEWEDEGAFLDPSRVLLSAVVVARDGTRSNVHTRSDLGVAKVGEV